MNAAVKHALNSTAVATCGGCPARWKSRVLAHCGACHHSFGSVDLFDRHRSSTGPHGACVLPNRNGVTLVDGVWREQSWDVAGAQAAMDRTRRLIEAGETRSHKPSTYRLRPPKAKGWPQ